MEFYAYDARPGTPSIWALREEKCSFGCRKNQNLLQVIGKFYNSLVDTAVIDHLLFLMNKEPNTLSVKDTIPKFKLTKISVKALSRETNHETISGLSMINDEICSVIIFKFFQMEGLSDR